MDYLRQIEDDLVTLGTEIKRKYPEVKDATDRALQTLKTVREMYVSEMMRRRNEKDRTVKFPQSSDITAPYILACNYADANPKVIAMALNGIQMLLNYEIVPPSDVKNVLRVLSIQTGSGRAELQLKLLQILLQLANSLTHNSTSSEYLTESTVCMFFTLSFQLCDARNNVSVTSTAFATARQILALVLDGTKELFYPKVVASSSVDTSIAPVSAGGAKAATGMETAGSLPLSVSVSSEQASASVTLSAQRLIKDIVLFVRGQQGEWIKGVIPPTRQQALDLLYDALSGWKILFQTVPSFQALIKDSICPALRPLLKRLQEDFVFIASRSSSVGGSLGVGVVSAASFTSRVVRIARCLLLDFLHPIGMLDEFDLIVTLMVHSLQPDRSLGLGPAAQSGLDIDGKSPKTSSLESEGVGDIFGHSQISSSSNSSGNQAAAGLISRFNNPVAMGLGNLGKAAMAAIPAGLTAALSNNAAVSSGSSGASSLASSSSTGGPGVGSATLSNSNFLMLSPTGSFGLTPSGGAIGSGTKTQPRIPSHPAGACLEALLSFYLSPVTDAMLGSEAGCKTLGAAMTHTLISVSALFASAVAVASNVSDLEEVVRGSHLITLLEGVLTGAETDVEYVVRCLHDHLISSASIEASEVMVLAFQLLQFVTRLLIKLSLQSVAPADSSINGRSASQQPRVFFSTEVWTSLTPKLTDQQKGVVRGIMLQVCDTSYESVRDACRLLLSKVEYAGLVRRSVGVLSELALTAGYIGLYRPCDYIIAALCKFTVPSWHGQELVDDSGDPTHRGPGGGVNNQNTPSLASDVLATFIRWRHIQAQVRLIQVTSVLANVITDWDSVVDAFDQIYRYFIIQRAPLSDEVTEADVEKIFTALERFKKYTIFLSDDALVRLMTSLVGMSLNNLAVSANRSSSASSSSAANGVNSAATAASSNVTLLKAAGASYDNHVKGPSYMTDGLSNGSISFSMAAVVEITKMNASRVSIIWQMVTSHLRMIASLRSPLMRRMAVAATHDIINTSLDFISAAGDPTSSPFQTLFASIHFFDYGSSALPRQSSPLLSDDVIFNWLVPSFETAFSGGTQQKLILSQRMAVGTASSRGTDLAAAKEGTELQLSQEDLLVSLKLLGSVQYDDVRVDVVGHLFELLQGQGHLLTGEEGWPVIIVILSAVPASMDVQSALGALTASATAEESEMAVENHEESDRGNEALPWPKQTLFSAFNCIKFAVDEFLDAISASVSCVECLVTCLSNFARQKIEVNISLTSVEMLWKVTDAALARLRSRKMKTSATPAFPAIAGDAEDMQSLSTILDAMVQCLLLQSMDSRPEVRNSAMNTLFAATTSNAPLISAGKWKELFDDVIFPLFDRTSARSRSAMVNKDGALTPFLKKGVRMAVHHSRDTAYKQWSETRTIALRGLSRVLKTCTRFLLQESWFRDMWDKSLEVCKIAIQTADFDLEVAVAGIDVLLGILKIAKVGGLSNPATEAVVSIAPTPPPPPLLSGVRKPGPPGDVGPSADMLAESARASLWQVTWEAVEEASRFHSQNIELALHMCQTLAAIYVDGVDAEFRYSENVRVLLSIVVVLCHPRLSPRDHQIVSDKVLEVQLQRSVMSLLKSIRLVDSLVTSSFVSSLAEICFSNQIVQIESSAVEDMDATSLAVGEKEVGVHDSLGCSLVPLAPCPDKLRADAGFYLTKLLALYESEATGAVSAAEAAETGAVATSEIQSIPKGSGSLIADIVFRRFVMDVCRNSLDARKQLFRVEGDVESRAERDDARSSALTDTTAATAATVVPSTGGFLSSFGLGGMWASATNSSAAAATAARVPAPTSRVIPSAQTLHELQSLSSLPQHPHTSKVTSHTQESVWCGYLPITDVDIDVLIAALQLSETSSSGNNVKASPKITPSSRHLATATANVNSISPTLWENVVVSAACIFSPWQRYEVQARMQAPTSAPVSESKLCSFLGRLFEPSIFARLQDAALFGVFIDSIVASVRLSLHTALESQPPRHVTQTALSTPSKTTASTSTQPQPAPLIAFHCNSVLRPLSTSLAIVAFLREKLLAVIADTWSETSIERNLKLHLQRRALLGYLLIAKDMLMFMESMNDTIPDIFYEECNVFLDGLSLFEISMDFLPSPAEFGYDLRSVHHESDTTETLRNRLLDDLVREWMHVVMFEQQQQQPLAAPFVNTSTGGSSNDAPSSAATSGKGVSGASTLPVPPPLHVVSPSSSQISQAALYSTHSTSAAPGGISDVWGRSHILLIAPYLLRVASVDGRSAALSAVKRTIRNLISSFDFIAFADTSRLASIRCTSLEHENSRLRAELLQVKSAAALPF